MAIYEGLKRCCRCKEWFPATLEFFYRSAGRNSDGFQGYCKPCTKAIAVAWQKANPEKKAASDAKQDLKPERVAKMRLRKRRFYAADPSKSAVRVKAWNEANPGRSSERARRWAAANPEAAKAAQDRHNAKPERRQYLRDLARFRRALRVGSGGEFVTQAAWQKVIDAFGRICCYCDVDGQMTMDHIDPISRGGLHHIGNLVPACERCNKSKRIKTVEIFAPARAASIRAKALECEALYAQGPLSEVTALAA